MKTINTSLFDFPRIVRDFVYVDKTAQIYKIARPDSDCLYFLSRPRDRLFGAERARCPFSQVLLSKLFRKKKVVS